MNHPLLPRPAQPWLRLKKAFWLGLLAASPVVMSEPSTGSSHDRQHSGWSQERVSDEQTSCFRGQIAQGQAFSTEKVPTPAEAANLTAILTMPSAALSSTFSNNPRYATDWATCGCAVARLKGAHSYEQYVALRDDMNGHAQLVSQLATECASIQAAADK